MDFADAVNLLNDEVAACCARAENRGLTSKEVITELRRIADELETFEGKEEK